MSIKDIISRRDLEREFIAVRKVYFPRWDNAGGWRCRFLRAKTTRVDCHGLADWQRKIIYVRDDTENLIGVLIHEICHAVTPSTNHGRPWQSRMLKAATVADRTGESRLAESLRDEIVSYQRDAEVVTPKAIYCEIRDCVSDLKGIPSFRSVAKVVAQKHMMTVEIFLKRYSRAKKVYDEAASLKHEFMRSSENCN